MHKMMTESDLVLCLYRVNSASKHLLISVQPEREGKTQDGTYLHNPDVLKCELLTVFWWDSVEVSQRKSFHEILRAHRE